MKAKTKLLATFLMLFIGMMFKPNVVEAEAVTTSDGFIIEDGVLTGYTGSSEIITVPNTVTSIGNAAFQNCTTMQIITLPNTITSIGASAFSGCENLIEIIIPESVTEIGRYAFYNCDSLIKADIRAHLNTLYSSTFKSCLNLKCVYIADVYDLEDSFEGCYNIECIYLPDTLVILAGTCNIIDSTKLKYVRLPNNWRFKNDDLNERVRLLNGVLVNQYANPIYITDSLEWQDAIAEVGGNYISETYNFKNINLPDKHQYDGKKVNLTAKSHDSALFYTFTHEEIKDIGTYTVTATFDTKWFKEVTGDLTIAYTFEIYPADIKCQRASTLDIGETNTLKIETVDNEYPTVVSSNPEVASIDENMVVTGISEGTTTISISANNHNSLEFDITVVDLSILSDFEVTINENIDLSQWISAPIYIYMNGGLAGKADEKTAYKYSIDEGITWNAFEEPYIKWDADAKNILLLIKAYNTKEPDYESNVVALNINYDATNPIIQSLDIDKHTVTVNAEDITSGLSTYSLIKIDKNEIIQTQESNIFSIEENGRYKIVVKDAAGNTTRTDAFLINDEEEAEGCNHNKDLIKYAIEPTCCEEGYSGDKHCSLCNTLQEIGEKLPATGNHIIEIRGKKASTCTECGYTGDQYCTNGGKLISSGSVEPTLNHDDSVIRSYKDATCKKEGYTGDKYCLMCNTLQKKGEKIPIKEHQYDKETAIFTKEATVDTEGYAIYKCKHCTSTITEIIPVLQPEDDPSTGEDEPSTEEDEPSTEEDKPSTGGDKPSTEEDKPSTGGDKPSTGEDKPSTGGDKPSTGEDKPSTGEDNPSTGEDNPSIGGDEPSTGEDKPSTEGDEPSTGEDKPSTGEDNPSIGGDEPSTEEDKPSTGEDKPSTGEDKPSTGEDKPSKEKDFNDNLQLQVKAAKNKKAIINKLTNGKGKKLVVKLKKASGYSFEIKVSTDKKFKKSVKTYKTSKTSYTIKKLKKGKKYYVKVRTYKKIDGKTYYGKWSKIKYVKIKK